MKCWHVCCWHICLLVVYIDVYCVCQMFILSVLFILFIPPPACQRIGWLWYSGSLSSGSDVSTQTQLLSVCMHSLFLRCVWQISVLRHCQKIVNQSIGCDVEILFIWDHLSNLIFLKTNLEKSKMLNCLFFCCLIFAWLFIFIRMSVCLCLSVCICCLFCLVHSP